MAGPFDKVMPSVAKILTKSLSGATASLIRRNTGTYDPEIGRRVGEVGETSYSIWITPPAPFSRNLIDGTRILTGDLQIYVPAKDLEVEPNAQTDTVVIEGISYRIVSVEKKMSGTLVALYWLHLRK